MKKKSASKSAFFNLRVLIGLCVALAGVSLALLALDAYAVNGAPVKIRNHIITASNDPLVPARGYGKFGWVTPDRVRSKYGPSAV